MLSRINKLFMENKGLITIGSIGLSGIYGGYKWTDNINTKLDKMENNHLYHMEKDMRRLEKDVSRMEQNIQHIDMKLDTINTNITTILDKLILNSSR